MQLKKFFSSMKSREQYTTVVFMETIVITEVQEPIEKGRELT